MAETQHQTDDVRSRAEGRPPFVVVVGVELDETGETALDEAFTFARREPRAQLHLVHVVTDVDDALRSEARADDRATLLEQRMAALRDVVLRRWRAAPGGDAERVSLHIGLGDREREIVQFAADLGADLILVGTHGRSRLAKVFTPSIAEALTRSAPCPVLVARPKDYDGMATSPEIEPPGPASSAGDRPRLRARGYRYSTSLPYHVHDSNIMPTGVRPRGMV
ncbi:MAG TPA: universal stress protein [Polyangiaceae bacterium]|nr:universal stress protein [Polyangiaceae bacterium]